MTENKIKIVLTDYGLSNNFGDFIEINRKLKKDKPLYNYVLNHELSHTDKRFSLEDVKADFKINLRMSLKLIYFILKNPSVWYEFLPVYKRDNRLVYDINMILSYGLIAFLVLVLFLIF